MGLPLQTATPKTMIHRKLFSVRHKDRTPESFPFQAPGFSPAMTCLTCSHHMHQIRALSFSDSSILTAGASMVVSHREKGLKGTHRTKTAWCGQGTNEDEAGPAVSAALFAVRPLWASPVK